MATSPHQDRSIRWTLRIVGLLLGGMSLYLLILNLGLGVIDDIFFTAGLLLGTLTVAAGFLPGARRRTEPQAVSGRSPSLASSHR